MKSSPEDIRRRFDQDVERFSNLDTGQAATMDARLCMELVTGAAAAATPGAKDLLDIGAGAGNYTLMMLGRIPDLNCTLVDLSGAMLERARQRVVPQTRGVVTTLQTDMRDLKLSPGSVDIVLAAATLHHLRTDDEWQRMFDSVYAALRSKGSFWIFDYVEQATPAIQKLMEKRHGDYLVELKGGGEAGAAYRDHVFAYIEQEDTPRSVNFQLRALERAGFGQPEILHKNSLFAAFGAQKV